MMTHQQLSTELYTLAYNLSNISPSVSLVGQETLNRSIINRLYYALYNKIIDELPQLKTSQTGNKHEQIVNILKRNSHNSTCKNAYNVFTELKTLRIWADYKPTIDSPPSNLANLLYKTNTIINYKKILP